MLSCFNYDSFANTDALTPKSQVEILGAIIKSMSIREKVEGGKCTSRRHGITFNTAGYIIMFWSPEARCTGELYASTLETRARPKKGIKFIQIQVEILCSKDSTVLIPPLTFYLVIRYIQHS